MRKDWTHVECAWQDVGDRRRGAGGVTTLSAQDLYEFALEGGSSVHLHDGDCIGISYQPSQARLTLSFLFEPCWSPATHPAGCTVRLIFDGAEIIEWQHDPGPQAEAGQCSDLRYCKPRVFTLDLLNDQLSFAAHSCVDRGR